MAQDQTVTDEGIGELVKLWSIGSTGASVMKSIVCLTTTGGLVCTVANTDVYSTTGLGCATSSTGVYAIPVTSTGSGLSLVDIDTVSQDDSSTTNDTITFDHEFTCSSTAAVNVSGVMILNDDDDTSYVVCCFASNIPMENTDTLTIDGQVQINQAST